MSVQVSSYIDQLSTMVSQMTGLSKNVILAQWNAEEGISSVDQWFSNNPAGITHGNSKVDALSIGVNKAGFDIFPDAQTGAKAYATLLNTDPNYAGIRATAGKSEQEQLDAIISSPWEENHYNKPEGNLLMNSYNSLTGSSLVADSSSGSTAVVTTTSAGSSSGTFDKIMNTVKFDGIYALLFGLLLFALYVTFVS